MVIRPFQAKIITEAEEKYDILLKTLDPQLSLNYQRRCEQATKEGMMPASKLAMLRCWTLVFQGHDLLLT